MFRLLGLHPGPDITAAAAASLAGIRPAQARHALGELARGQPAHRARPGPLRLPRPAARLRRRAGAATPTAEPSSARPPPGCSTTTCTPPMPPPWCCNPHRDADQPGPGRGRGRAGALADYQQAMAWFEAEHRVLLAAIDQAAQRRLRHPRLAAALTLTTFFDRRGYWRSYPTAQRTALASAQRLGDREAQALVHRSLGHASTQVGAYRGCGAPLRTGARLVPAARRPRGPGPGSPWPRLCPRPARPVPARARALPGGS